MRTLTAADFSASQLPAELGDDEIHLWFFPRYRSSDAAKSNGMDCLRGVLAAYLATDASTLRIERNAAGKPYLADAKLQFNISHSADALLVGLSRSQPLGVDLESGLRERPYLEIARRYFTGAEAAALAALPGERLAPSFLELWSAKEAVLKAIGRGIAFGLDRVGFEFGVDDAVWRLDHIAEEAGPLADWRTVRLKPTAGATGMLAWQGPQRRVRAFVAAEPATISATLPSLWQ